MSALTSPAHREEPRLLGYPLWAWLGGAGPVVALAALVYAHLAAPEVSLLTDPISDYAHAPDTRAASLIGTLVGPGGRKVEVHGQIDRLVATASETLILDFKTNRTVPTVTPAAYVGQLALYRALLRELRPGLPVRTALLWTETAELRAIPDAELDAAIARILTQA